MKEKFENRRLKGSIKIKISETRNWIEDKWTLCSNMIAIISEYLRLGYKLTLRQLYYQLVSKELIPNSDVVYKKIGTILDDLRYSGMVDWNAIEDRGRVPYLKYWVLGISDALEDTISQYHLDLQKGQKVVVEVWTEKDAISGILKRVTNKYHVRLSVNKGYSSSAAIYQAYQRFIGELKNGRRVKILYLGDHDSSGLDMIRDIRERLIFMLYKGEGFNLNGSEEINRYMKREALEKIVEYGEEFVEFLLNNGIGVDVDGFEEDELLVYILCNLEVKHIGLTMEQIKKYNPPPNPAKMTDPRADKYIKKYGKVSWEVDALKPQVLEKLVSEEIENSIDMDLFNEVLFEEEQDKEKLRKFIDENNTEGDEDED